MPEREMTADEAIRIVAENLYRWVPLGERRTEYNEALSVLRRVVEENEKLRARIVGLEVDGEMLLRNYKAELARLEAELAALRALEELPDNYCLACGGTGGHNEGCPGVSGLVAFRAELARLKAPVMDEDRKEMLNALDDAILTWMGDEGFYRPDNRAPWRKIRALITAPSAQEADRKFITHIQAHLGEGQRVVCKICGKTAEEIIHVTE